jgi:5-methylthioadenosine/S-adenosylhomocysteine deaminase
MSPAATPKRWALKGRIVTMAARNDVVNGTIYVEDNRIKAIAGQGQPAPAGFEAVQPFDSRGTVYPGLIELHNHLSYDILPLWQVPKQFENRDTWADNAAFKTEVNAPMSAIAVGDNGTLLPALVRYVESKCLVAGTTTSQGITLKQWSGQIHRYYKGVLRTCEIGRPPALAQAHSHIADVEANDRARFHTMLKSAAQRNSCVLLHLSEGTNPAAREHFLALRDPQGVWAIEPSLAGIHCTALTADDFAVMAEHKGSMVWSPLSNLLLYGKTGDVKAARAAGVLISLGSDWSPSGSKNLLGELKVAKEVSQLSGIGLDDYDIVALATANPAKILHWDKNLGTLEAGKLADFIVITGTTGDAYQHLIKARENDISLVVIDGRPRYGTTQTMQGLGATGEAITVKGTARIVDFDTPDDEPEIERISLAEATQRLTHALADLGTLHARAMTNMAAMAAGRPTPHPVWQLALDEQFHNHVELRPHLPYAGAPTGPQIADVSPAAMLAVAPPLHPVKLDPLTVVDDPQFLPVLTQERNLPPGLAGKIVAYYA